MDNNREYGPKKLSKLIKALRIIIKVTILYTLEQDNKAKRSIRTIVERTRTTIINIDIL